MLNFNLSKLCLVGQTALEHRWGAKMSAAKVMQIQVFAFMHVQRALNWFCNVMHGNNQLGPVMPSTTF